MKRLALCLLMLVALPVQADDVDVFLARFRSALVARDAAVIADLTQLPFLYEGRRLDRAAFIRAVPVLFDARLSRCLAQARPLTEGQDRLLHCAPYTVYLRTGADRRWRLAEFNADGEDMP